MKRIFTAILSVVLLISNCLPPTMATDTIVENDIPAAEDISVSAYAAYLMDMDTGMMLYEYNGDDTNYPASTTKVMTAYLCLKYGDPEDTVTVSSNAFSDLSQQASKGGLVVGETMTVHRLLQALLVVSASEAANVVAEYVSGSRDDFVELMNQEAEELGCTGTHFANCHGLPNYNHYTTAHDMALIAQAAMGYQEFRDIVGAAVTTMEATNKHGVQIITSTNGLLPGSSYPDYSYKYAIGVKTGHTSVAGYCLVSAADKDGKELLCVVMGCGSRTSSFTQSKNLLEWGYDNYEALTYGQKVADPSLPDEDNVDSLLEEAEDSEYIEEVAPSQVVLEVPVSNDNTPSVIDSSPTSENVFTQLTGDMLPVVLCLSFAVLFFLILIVILVVVVIRRKR